MIHTVLYLVVTGNAQGHFQGVYKWRGEKQVKDNPHAGTTGDDNSEIQEKWLTNSWQKVYDWYSPWCQPARVTVQRSYWKSQETETPFWLDTSILLVSLLELVVFFSRDWSSTWQFSSIKEKLYILDICFKMKMQFQICHNESSMAGKLSLGLQVGWGQLCSAQT